MESLDLNLNAKKLMAFHGKSFYFASKVLSKLHVHKVYDLYQFCRFADDLADENEASAAKKHFHRLRNEFEDPSRSDTESSKLIQNLLNYGILKEELLHLCSGVESDVDFTPIKNQEDLTSYCYAVAGVVGVMMCPLIGVQNEKAKAFAADLGIAMQLTNICRDVLEDAANERLYLPLNELESVSLNLTDLKETKYHSPERLKRIVKEHLEKADTYYASALYGLSYIPLKSRFGVLLALCLYRAIGLKIKAQGFEVLRGRTYLSFSEKILASFKALKYVFKISFWKPTKKHCLELHKHLQNKPGLAK